MHETIIYVGHPASVGAPGEIRTPDLAVRSRTLYPTELRAQHVKQKATSDFPLETSRK